MAWGPYNTNRNWTVPLTYTTSADPTGKRVAWIHDDGHFTLNENSSVTWIKGKVEPFGLYRVNYDTKGWQALSDLLSKDHDSLPAEQRKSLFNDAFALARSGMLDYKMLLNMTRYAERETDQSVKEEVAVGLTSIRDSLSAVISFDDNNHIVDDRATVDKYMKSLDLQPATRHDDKCSCKKSKEGIKSVYEEWLSEPQKSIASDRISDVYSYAIETNKRQDWDMLYHQSTKTRSSTNKWVMQTTLACTRDMTQLTRLLNYCLDPSKIDAVSVQTILEKVACTTGGRLLAFRFLRKNWQKLLEM
ncbi:aminopeptidase [Elysia marginata]|uniref:Aminopeptidase n=1 Tax=Elysia marginata TaxID=1093978 RepID=A0AAV4JTB7_9GAST|nr:aminopeptidase [Elysia marginata]